MDQQYKEARNKAVNYENDLKDQVDNDDSIGRSLLNEARQLVSEIDAKKNPRSLESRIKTILNLLDKLKDQGAEAMDQSSINASYRNYEELSWSLREFDNY